MLKLFHAFFKKIKVNSVDNTSAIGNAYQIPFIPKYLGRIKTNGIRKKPCLDKVNSKAGMALPMA